MRTFILVISTLLFLVPPVLADGPEKPTLLIAPPRVTQKLQKQEPEVARSTVDLLSGLLVKQYRFPSTLALTKAMKATGVSTVMLHDDLEACAIFARAAGVDLVITGKLHSFGETIVVHLRLVEIPEKGPALPKAMAMQKCDYLDEIPAMLPEIVKAFGLIPVPEPKRVAATVKRQPKQQPMAKPRPKPAEVDVKKMIGNLDADDAGVRFSSAIELGRSGKAEAVEALMVVATRDKDMFVRRAAARSLGELGDKKAVPALIEVLGDKDYFVSFCANQAIITLTGHDCGFRDGLTEAEKTEALRAARTWWKGESEGEGE